MSSSDSQPPMHSHPSYQSSSPSNIPVQSSYQSDSIVIPVLPQFLVDSNDQFDPHSQFEQPPYKRHRVSDDNNSQFRAIPSNNLPVNKGATNIFFKTKMCAKFKAGICRNGENCNFAHGEQDKRQPPPNWQELVGLGARSTEEDRPVGNWDEDQRIIHRMKLCKKFYSGEVCPYGDRCNFLHEEPSKFRDDGGRYRESSVISIGTTAQSVGQGSVVGVNVAEVNGSVSSVVSINAKLVYWKTKLCTKMETIGHCPFGEKCHFAHGVTELQLHCGLLEVEVGNAGSILTKPQQSILTNNALPIPTSISNVPSFVEERQNNKVLLKWKGPKKINKIYGDWLDDLPLITDFNNGVES